MNYSSYYYNCNPIKCYYTITKKFHIPTIVTTIIGLVGGISVILKILISPVVKFIRRNRNIQTNNIQIHQQGKINIRTYTSYCYLLVSIMDRIMKLFNELNLFKTIETDRLLEIRQDQIISTRLYIILWITSVILLSIYTGLTEKKIVITIDNPSLSTVRSYQLQDLNKFLCPCTKTSIPFQTFTTFNFNFHQVNS